jgi:hypothetical protein
MGVYFHGKKQEHLHHRFRFCHYLPAVKIPPAPFGKGGDIWGFLWPDEIPPAPFTKGGDIWGFTKGGDIWAFARDILVAAIRISHFSSFDT